MSSTNQKRLIEESIVLAIQKSPVKTSALEFLKEYAKKGNLSTKELSIILFDTDFDINNIASEEERDLLLDFETKMQIRALSNVELTDTQKYKIVIGAIAAFQRVSNLFGVSLFMEDGCGIEHFPKVGGHFGKISAIGALNVPVIISNYMDQKRVSTKKREVVLACDIQRINRNLEASSSQRRLSRKQGKTVKI